jgi:rhodanese-related sulfurtransferase
MASRPDRIDVEVASEYLFEGRGIAVDARPDPDEEQIPESRRVVPDAGAATDAALLSLPRELLFIVYCDTPEEAASARVARRARELGLGDAAALEGGFSAWKSAEMPITVPGPSPSFLDSLSFEQLERMGRLVYWLGLAQDFQPAMRLPRRELSRRFVTVPAVILLHLAEFLRDQLILDAPVAHPARVANLTAEVRARVESMGWRRLGHRPTDEELARMLEPTDSLLLTRWLEWVGKLPDRAAWWEALRTLPIYR